MNRIILIVLLYYSTALFCASKEHACPWCAYDRSKKSNQQLMQAVQKDDSVQVRTLLLTKADPNGIWNERLPLGWASSRAMVTLLIEHKASVNALDFARQTPLSRALDTKNDEVLATLLEHKADPNYYSPVLGRPALFLAYSAKSAQALIDAKAKIDARDEYFENTPLHRAVDHKNKEVVRVLLKAKAPIDAQNTVKATPLHKAIEQGDKSIARILINARAKLKQKNLYGQRPIDMLLQYMPDK